MRVQRVRPRWSDEELRTIYATPHDHRIYGMGHHLRVETTITLGKAFAYDRSWESIADLSCGNGVIASAISEGRTPILGDFAPGYPITGPLEETLPRLDNVDCYVLSETLEHLDKPLDVLRLIRSKSLALVLSTPLEAWDDSNGEHYWAWDREGVEAHLEDTGWNPTAFASLDSRVFGEPYLYGMWVCE